LKLSESLFFARGLFGLFDSLFKSFSAAPSATINLFMALNLFMAPHLFLLIILA